MLQANQVSRINEGFYSWNTAAASSQKESNERNRYNILSHDLMFPVNLTSYLFFEAKYVPPHSLIDNISGIRLSASGVNE